MYVAHFIVLEGFTLIRIISIVTLHFMRSLKLFFFQNFSWSQLPETVMTMSRQHLKETCLDSIWHYLSNRRVISKKVMPSNNYAHPSATSSAHLSDYLCNSRQLPHLELLYIYKRLIEQTLKRASCQSGVITRMNVWQLHVCSVALSPLCLC